MKERKKLRLLVVLLVTLAGILTWQGMSRETKVQHLDNDVEQKALSVLDGMLKAGLKSGWDATANYWVKLPDSATRAEYVNLMGGPEYTFQGSIPARNPSELILYATFQTGNQLEILVSRRNDEYKIVSLKKL